MARWAPARADVIGEIADEVLHNYRRGRAVVAIDGRPGSQQAEFADDLAEAIRARDAVAYRADGDAPDFRDVAVAAFRRGEGEYEDEGSAVLIVDGTRLHSQQLLPVFVYSVWITSSAAEHSAADGGQVSYETHSAPRVRATANVDNSDPEHPRRTFADSC